MDSIGNDVSFMDLLSMVAANAANSDVKVHHAVQLHEDLVIGTEEQVLAKQQITHNNKRSSASMDGGISNGNMDCRMESVVHPVPVLSERISLFGSGLPDESIGTSLFVDSSLKCGSSFCSDGISKASASRSFSNFLLEEECVAMDVTSEVREYHGGTIEESMRKYCEDKKRVMFEPEIGMEFSSTEEAFQYYNMYSWVTGFSIRLGDNYTTKTKQRTMQEYLCRRQGNGDEMQSYDEGLNKRKLQVSVIFAGVLLTNEAAENFKWAIEEFVAMMGGKAPQTILTDQSLAMTIAIKENLPSTNHRWCKWHILRKAQEALGHVHKLHNTFSDDFNKVVNHMLTPEEFENGWEYLTRKYDLAGNPFMTRAFEVRDKWAKPYFNDIFGGICCELAPSGVLMY